MRRISLGLGWGKRIRALVLLGSLALIVPACSGGDENVEASTAPAREDVQITAFVFQPKVLEIEAGTTVRWMNGDEILHTATSGRQTRQGVPGVTEAKDARPDGTFDLEMDGRGSSASFTFEQPGEYEYFCRVHAAMSARVVVA
jgi:plastocyanin